MKRCCGNLTRTRGWMMPKSTKKGSNELEFQGQVISWFNDYIAKHPTLALETATQEKPHKDSGKRNDLIIWRDRAAVIAFLTIELKTPATLINDPDRKRTRLNSSHIPL